MDNTYRLVSKKYFCHSCTQPFCKLVPPAQVIAVSCENCASQTCEEIIKKPQTLIDNLPRKNLRSTHTEEELKLPNIDDRSDDTYRIVFKKGSKSHNKTNIYDKNITNLYGDISKNRKKTVYKNTQASKTMPQRVNNYENTTSSRASNLIRSSGGNVLRSSQQQTATPSRGHPQTSSNRNKTTARAQQAQTSSQRNTGNGVRNSQSRRNIAPPNINQGINREASRNHINEEMHREEIPRREMPRREMPFYRQTTHINYYGPTGHSSSTITRNFGSNEGEGFMDMNNIFGNVFGRNMFGGMHDIFGQGMQGMLNPFDGFFGNDDFFGHSTYNSLFSDIFSRDFFSFFNTTHHNFMRNFSQNFQQNVADPYEVARRMSEQSYEARTDPTSHRAIKKLPIIKITEKHCKIDKQSGATEFPRCTVCCEDFGLGDEGQLLPCAHIFHQDCILPWLKQHRTCPVCRFELPGETQF